MTDTGILLNNQMADFTTSDVGGNQVQWNLPIRYLFWPKKDIGLDKL